MSTTKTTTKLRDDDDVIPRTRLNVMGDASTHDDYEVHRIYCIGRNYGEHAIEMGGTKDDTPFFFQKPYDAATNNRSIPYPSMTNQLQQEAELMVCLNEKVALLKTEEDNNNNNMNPADCIFGYALGCDLTRRDLQSEAKQQRRPWDVSKAFDQSAPCGPIVPVSKLLLADKEYDPITNGKNLQIQCTVNGELRQQSPLDHMIWKIPEIIVILSKYYRLRKGDVIMTGTPAGVGDLHIGDEICITCMLTNLDSASSSTSVIPECRFTIGSPAT